jgi:hypothetical protein
MTLPEQPVSTGKLAASILVVAVAGTPLVAWIWESLNELLSGHVEPVRLLLTVPALVLLYALLRWLAKRLERFERNAAQR